MAGEAKRVAADAVNEWLQRAGVARETRRKIRRLVLDHFDGDRDELRRHAYFHDLESDGIVGLRVPVAGVDDAEVVEAFRDSAEEWARRVVNCSHCGRPLTLEHLVEAAEQGFDVGLRRAMGNPGREN